MNKWERAGRWWIENCNSYPNKKEQYTNEFHKHLRWFNTAEELKKQMRFINIKRRIRHIYRKIIFGDNGCNFFDAVMKAEIHNAKKERKN